MEERTAKDHLTWIIKAVLMIIGLIILTFGLMIVISSLMGYLGGNSSEGSQLKIAMLGSALICFPLAVFFSARAISHYRRHTTDPDNQELPFRFLSLVLLSGGLVLASVVSLGLFLVLQL